jgi:hypothetical protein
MECDFACIFINLRFVVCGTGLVWWATNEGTGSDSAGSNADYPADSGEARQSASFWTVVVFYLDEQPGKPWAPFMAANWE